MVVVDGVLVVDGGSGVLVVVVGGGSGVLVVVVAV